MRKSETRVVLIEKFSDGWIDYTKSRPKPISLVLIWTNISLEATLGYYTGRDWMYLSVNDNFWLKKQPHIKVLYWQPLPSVPKAFYNKVMNEVKTNKKDAEQNNG